MKALGLVALALLAGACRRSPDLACPTDGHVLAQADDELLRCEDTAQVESYVELLAGRAATLEQRYGLRGALVARFASDPAGVHARIRSVHAQRDRVASATGVDGAEFIATAGWDELRGKGPLTQGLDDAVPPVQAALAPVRVSDDERLVLSEMSVEAWILYASLCREAQQGAPLKVSVADRVQLYRKLGELFDAAPRAGKVSLAALGPYWAAARDAWSASTYERQQGWVMAAPLPPPMQTDSLGYANAVFDGNLTRHAAVLHERVGPFLPRPVR